MGRKCNRSIQLSLVTAACVGLGASTSRATPLVFEDFNPAAAPAATDLAGTPAAGGGAVVGEFGLTGNWINSSSIYGNQQNNATLINRTTGENVNGTQLVYPTNSSLPAPSGGTARNPGGYQNNLYTANLSSPIPLSGSSGTYYFSYLLTNGAGNVDFDAQLAFVSPTNQIYAGFGYNDSEDISVKTAPGLPFGAGNSYNATGVSFGQGFSGGNIGLVVGELVIAPSGVDTVNLSIFRYTAGGSSANLPTSTPTSWDLSYATPVQSDTVNQLGIFLTGNNTPEIDAIRLGTTYSDVVGTVTAVTLNGNFTTYTGAVNGNFDKSTQNFKFNNSPVVYADGNDVLFDDTATGTHNVAVLAGGVSPATVSFNNTTATAGYVLTGGSITATGALTMAGSGTVTLQNANTYSGGATLNNGTLVLGAGGSLATNAIPGGAGKIIFNGGTLRALANNANFLSANPASLQTGGATIDSQAFDITVGEVLSDNAVNPGGSLTKTGTGSLTFTSHNTYTGGTIVNAGTLNLSTGGGNGAVLGTLTVNSGGTVNANNTDALGFITGFVVNTLVVNSGGNFVLKAGNEGYLTNLVMGGGTVSATVGGSFNFNTGFGISNTASSTTSVISSDVAIRGTSLNITTVAGTTPSGADLNISGRLIGGGPTTLSISGTGTTVLGGVNSYGGGTTITGGTVVAANSAAFGSVIDNQGVSLDGGAKLVLSSLAAPSGAFSLPIDLTYSGGGAIQLAPTPSYSSGTVGNITVADGGTVALTIGANPASGVTHGALTTPSITLADPNNSRFDLGKNDLIITAESLATVTAQVASGFSQGPWTGPGIDSSAASSNATLNALGVIVNHTSTGAIFTTFDGVPVADGNILVKYTYYGDADLSGTVTSNDYTLIDNGFASNGSLTGWANGDFNYDGHVDGSDYSLIDNAFNRQGASLAASPASMSALTASEISTGSAVPEPTTLGLFTVAAAGSLARRRRSK